MTIKTTLQEKYDTFIADLESNIEWIPSMIKLGHRAAKPGSQKLINFINRLKAIKDVGEEYRLIQAKKSNLPAFMRQVILDVADIHLKEMEAAYALAN